MRKTTIFCDYCGKETSKEAVHIIVDEEKTFEFCNKGCSLLFKYDSHKKQMETAMLLYRDYLAGKERWEKEIAKLSKDEEVK